MKTKDLCQGQWVLVSNVRGARQRFRADPGEGTWAAVQYTAPAPRMGHEWHRPSASSAWDVMFADGSWALSTRDAEWVTLS